MESSFWWRIVWRRFRAKGCRDRGLILPPVVVTHCMDLCGVAGTVDRGFKGDCVRRVRLLDLPVVGSSDHREMEHRG